MHQSGLGEKTWLQGRWVAAFSLDRMHAKGELISHAKTWAAFNSCLEHQLSTVELQDLYHWLPSCHQGFWVSAKSYILWFLSCEGLDWPGPSYCRYLRSESMNWMYWLSFSQKKHTTTKPFYCGVGIAAQQIHLRCWHLVWIPPHILASPLKIHLPELRPGKAGAEGPPWHLSQGKSRCSSWLSPGYCSFWGIKQQMENFPLVFIPLPLTLLEK